jgi:hypothetical protein
VTAIFKTAFFYVYELHRNYSDNLPLMSSNHLHAVITSAEDVCTSYMHLECPQPSCKRAYANCIPNEQDAWRFITPIGGVIDQSTKLFCGSCYAYYGAKMQGLRCHKVYTDYYYM